MDRPTSTSLTDACLTIPLSLMIKSPLQIQPLKYLWITSTCSAYLNAIPSSSTSTPKSLDIFLLKSANSGSFSDSSPPSSQRVRHLMTRVKTIIFILDKYLYYFSALITIGSHSLLKFAIMNVRMLHATGR